MNLSYGLAKTGGTGAGTFAFGTDLGIATNTQTNINIAPSKGDVATAAVTTLGVGYSSTLNGTIQCSVSGGSGTGAIVQIETTPTGILIASSVINPTAGFTNFQNSTITSYDVDNSAYSFVRDTATGTNAVSGTTTALTTTSSGSGTGATVLLTVSNGSVINTVISAVGSDYVAGEIISVSVANMQAAMNVINGGDATVILSKIDLLITESNITNGLLRIVNVLNGGSGYTAADVLTLQEIGGTETGTATITVGTLGIGFSTDASPNNIYPKGVTVSVGTQAATKTIEFVGMDDVNVIIGGFVAGTVFPYQFKQIIDAGTDAVLGNITILY
jgi:hypothetical protein